MPQRSWRHLLGKDNAHANLVSFGRWLDAYDVSAQRAVGVTPVVRIFDGHLQFRLQFGAVIQINQSAVQAQIANHGVFFEGLSLLGKTRDASPEMRFSPQAIPYGGEHAVS